MVLVCIVIIGVLLVFGAISTTKYIVDHDEEETEITTSATTTSTTPTTTSTTTTTSTVTYTTRSYKTEHQHYGGGNGGGNGGGGGYGAAASTPKDRENRLEDIVFKFYLGSTIRDFVDIPFYEPKRLLESPEFKKEAPTMVFFPGYHDFAEDECIYTIVTKYLKLENATNIVLFDWTNMAHGNYLEIAAPNVKKVGEAAAEQFNKLFKAGLLLESLHLLSHSLGSHVAGYVGRVLKKKYKKTIKRITGLDPVFPGFYPGSKDYQHISAEDAEFVDIVHTDAGGFGAPYRTGTADFWPNGGERIQPGCPKYRPRAVITKENICSHWRSWFLYAESVSNPEAFPASPAFNYSMFKHNPDPTNGMVYMGYNCDPTANGSYYFTTRDSPPFSYGMHGLYP